MNTTTQKYWLKQAAKLDASETPLFVTDLEIIRNKINEFREALPRIRLMYATKALSSPEVISDIQDLVDGFDIASFGEYQHLANIVRDKKKLGKNILYSNPVKIPRHIEQAYNQGVRRFAFDSAAELEKIAKHAPGSEAYLRVKVSDRGSSFPLSKKFGAEAVHAVAFFGTAKDLGLNPIGITFHVGSQSENLIVWEWAIAKSGEVIKRLQENGFEVSMLNIGGGFPAQYIEGVPPIKKIAKTINKSLKEHIPDSVEIYAEPGRYIVAESSIIVSTVIGREHRSGQEWLYLDIGVFQGLMECLEMDDWKYPVFTEMTHRSSSLPHSFTLTGPTCDAYDTIGLDIPLPSNMAIGDRVIIGSVGAYSIVYGSNFNGFSMPEYIFINKSKR